MGSGRGVEVRGHSIRIGFTFDGEYVKERLTANGQALPPTPKNIAYAERVAATVRDRIRHGTFVLADFFPDSPRAAGAKQEKLTVSKLAELYLASVEGLSPATVSQYANAINNTWVPMLGPATEVDSLSSAAVASKIGAHPWASAKLRNNYLIPLRRMFALHFTGKRREDNPLAEVKNSRTKKKLPDPLTLAERDAILADMAKHYDERVHAYFQFAFFTGMRPEELIALQWGDIDVRHQVARVQRVKTFKGCEREETKTKQDRDVDLCEPALAALKTMEKYTKAKGADSPVFEHPELRKPWHDERSQRDTYWKPSLRRCGIRARRAYATRHTFCTALCMAGVNPMYVAAQAGHSIQVLFDSYARWLSRNETGSERLRAALALLPTDFPRPQEPETENPGNPLHDNELPGSVFGRRNWIRTNDPHHVKVVL